MTLPLYRLSFFKSSQNKLYGNVKFDDTIMCGINQNMCLYWDISTQRCPIPQKKNIKNMENVVIWGLDIGNPGFIEKFWLRSGKLENLSLNFEYYNTRRYMMDSPKWGSLFLRKKYYLLKTGNAKNLTKSDKSKNTLTIRDYHKWKLYLNAPNS